MPNTTGGFQGALGGAGMGASIGSLGGPVGAGIGAGAGFLLGGLAGMGGDSREEQMRKALAARGRDIEQLIAQLQRQAGGQDSTTGLQLRQALDRGMGQQRALAASARPGQQGMAQRLMAQNQARMGSEAAGQASLLRLQEQMAARQALASLLLGARGQDLQAALGVVQQPTTGEMLLGGGIGGAQLFAMNGMGGGGAAPFSGSLGGALRGQQSRGGLSGRLIGGGLG